MEKRIHYSRIAELMQRKDASGRYKPFSMTYVKKDGQLRSHPAVTFSSIHSKGDTINLIVQGERRPKKYLRILILEINKHKIYL